MTVFHADFIYVTLGRHAGGFVGNKGFTILLVWVQGDRNRLIYNKSFCNMNYNLDKEYIVTIIYSR